MLSLCLIRPACLMRYMYKSIFLLASYNLAVSSRYSIIPLLPKFSEKIKLISNAADFVLAGVNGAVNGSGVCPPTTQSGSYSASPTPVQAPTKPNKNSDPSNIHRSSPHNNPAELVEKTTVKPKEKVGAHHMNASVQRGIV